MIIIAKKKVFHMTYCYYFTGVQRDWMQWEFL